MKTVDELFDEFIRKAQPDYEKERGEAGELVGMLKIYFQAGFFAGMSDTLDASNSGIGPMLTNAHIRTEELAGSAGEVIHGKHTIQ